ncbi:MAG: VTT domain-containing protein [Oscillospiraceae bacterium]|nr:VTT domain-containing protein [Oscillospiraceae bacterium]
MSEKKLKIWKDLWLILLLGIWSMVIVILIRHHGNLTLEDILAYKPASPVKAVLTMLGLFLLKSVDIFMDSAILYTANGIMFSPIAAILLNLTGLAITYTTPYIIGKTTGRSLLTALERRYPKLADIDCVNQSNDFLVSLLFRFCGLPLTPLSLYFGAMKMNFGKYMAGSMVGLLPILLSYTFLGNTAEKTGTGVIAAGIGMKFMFFLASALIYRSLIMKRKQAEKAKG